MFFVERTGVDALAVAIGNADGDYPVAPHLAFDVLEEIHKKVNIYSWFFMERSGDLGFGFSEGDFPGNQKGEYCHCQF